jgi:hypothetical protein
MKLVIAYLAVAYAVVEGVAYYLPLGGGAETGARLVLGGLVLGFPMAVVLAWTFDLTPSGVVRTPDAEWAEPTPEPTRKAWLVVTFAGIAAGVVLRMMRE